MELPPTEQSRLSSEIDQDGRGHRVRRPLIASLMSGGTIIWAWLIAGLFLYVDPAVDQPKHSDAVVVLAPTVTTGRLDYAESLMSDGYGSTLVISVPEDPSGNAPTDVCRAKRTYRIICFSPDPVTTQGEARAVRRLSEEHGWRSITVVTNDFHATRARTIIGRCYPHDLNVAAVRHDRSLTDWAYRFVYETAAFVKVVADPGC
jgi:hypothetical protein